MTSKIRGVQIFPITCKFLHNGEPEKNWSRIFSEDNFMANKLYSKTFFSKLILLIDNLENVIKKYDKSKFLIGHRSITSEGTKIFGRKCLGPLWKILTAQKSICEKLYPNLPLIDILYTRFLLTFIIFPQ